MAQFTSIPPLTKISIFFKEVTGLDPDIDVIWSAWLPGDPHVIEECLTHLRLCYRPCHLKILDDTEAGLHINPSSLLRQLLRPHGLNIQYRGSRWKIVKISQAIDRIEVDETLSWT